MEKAVYTIDDTGPFVFVFFNRKQHEITQT